jgi:hypothetical protein
MIANLDQWVAGLVQTACQQQLSFTAFSITLLLRKAGHHVMHDDVKNAVHELFDTGRMPGYTRESTEIVPGKWAWHYKPDVTSQHRAPSAVRSYDPTPAPALPQATPDPDPTAAPDGAAVEVRRRTSRSGLLLKKRWMEEIGALVKDRVGVYQTQDGLVVQTFPVKTAGALVQTYQIDRYGNLRIPERTLQAGGITSSQVVVDRSPSCWISLTEV